MLTHKDKQLVAAFLFNAGHANVQFVGKHVIYRDQTKGQRATDKLLDPQPILDLVMGKSLDAINKFNIRLIMMQIDPTCEVWQLWPSWTSLPDQVYENTSWTNEPGQLIKIAQENVFCEFRLS